MYTKFCLAKNIEVLRNVRGAVFLSKRTLYVYDKKKEEHGFNVARSLFHV